MAATLNNGGTEVSIQYQTDFASLANAQSIEAALQTAILGSVAQQDTPAATSYAKFSESLYSVYFYHTVDTDEASALEQWKDQFKGIDAGCHFPSLPYASHKPNVDASASCTIENLQWRNDCGVTTQIIASWALLQASYGGSAGVLIGACSLGAEHGAESGVMPTPMRMTIELDQSISSYLASVQSTIASSSKLPRLSIHRLRGLSGEFSLACDFQALLSVEGASSVQSKGQGPKQRTRSKL